MLQKGGKAAPCLQLSQAMYGWDCLTVNQLCSLWLHVMSPEQDGSPHFCAVGGSWYLSSIFVYIFQCTQDTASSEQCQSSNLFYQRNICELFLGKFMFIHFMVWLIMMRSIFIHCWIKCRPLFHVFVKQISDIFVTALNQGLIQFELKADIRIIVYMTQQTLGKVFSFFLFLLALSKTFLA